MQLEDYALQGFHDEMFDESGVARPEAKLLLDTIGALEDGQLQRFQRAAERRLVQMGITFNVYGDTGGTERIFPFDLIPRIVRSEEWSWIGDVVLSAGLVVMTIFWARLKEARNKKQWHKTP